MESDATSIFVSCIDELVEGIINLCNISIGTSGDDILTEFIKTYSAITIDVNSLELILNEDLEHGRECVILFAYTVILNSFLELISINFSILVKVSKFCNLIPQVLHDLAVGFKSFSREFTLSLKDGVPHSQALEVILVEDSIVVNVIEIPDNVFDAVIVRVSHD